MKTLIVGAGALGGLVAARLRAAGSPVWLATRNAEAAARLKASGLRVAGVGGALSVDVAEVAPVETVHAITRREIAPGPALLGRVLQASR